MTRVDALGDGSGFEVEDTYTYDLLGRLTGYEVQGNGSPNERSVTLQYNALGMLLYKSDVGVYTYGSQATAGVRPHALQQVSGYLNASYVHDLNGNLTWAGGGKYRSVSYTSFNLPDAQSGLAGPSGSPRYAWHYDEDHKRLKETHSGPAGTRTTWFLHPDNRGGLSFEREVAADGTPSNRHYLSAGSGVFAVLVTRGALPALGAGVMSPPAPSGTVTAVKLEYWHKDHLGSLLATTDHLGNVTARYAYDPFGKRRYTNGSYDAFGKLVIDWTSQTNAGTDRGYTGHEHLDDVGLVHMNGRLFDPTLARFMQADPFIQDPANLQNFDRYAYCYNNPLTCTDPSGEFIFLAVVAAKLGTEAMIAAALADLVIAKSMPELRPFIGLAWSIALAPGLNLVSLGPAQTAIAGFAGGAISSGSLKGGLQGAFSALAFNAVGDFIGKAGFVKALGQGGDFAAQVALHGVTGCVTSVAGGGKCSSGALSAAFSKALNFVPGLDGKPGQMTSGEMLANVAVRAVSGGVASVLGGGKFANGATTGAFSYLFNFLSHARFNRATGVLSVQDAQVGRNGGIAEGIEVQGNFFSGTDPDDQIAPGRYAILQRGGKDGFRLEAMDSTFGDDMNDSGQSLLRLHGPGRSNGCITACDASNWGPVRELIQNTKPIEVVVPTYRSITLPGGYLIHRWQTGTETIKWYGVITVK